MIHACIALGNNANATSKCLALITIYVIGTNG